MKRTALVIVALIAIGFVVRWYFDLKAEEEIQRIEQERRKEEVKLDVTNMVLRAKANSTWPHELCLGEGFRYERVLTVELERCWLAGQPILFVGTINDIASEADTLYRLSLGMSLLWAGGCFTMTELQLQLFTPKHLIDTLLNNHPDLLGAAGFSGIAVVAQIDTVRTEYILGDGGDRATIKVGEGKLLAFVYTGLVSF
jgi:hypothetical protein